MTAELSLHLKTWTANRLEAVDECIAQDGSGSIGTWCLGIAVVSFIPPHTSQETLAGEASSPNGHCVSLLFFRRPLPSQEAFSHPKQVFPKTAPLFIFLLRRYIPAPVMSMPCLPRNSPSRSISGSMPRTHPQEVYAHLDLRLGSRCHIRRPDQASALGWQGYVALLRCDSS